MKTSLRRLDTLALLHVLSRSTYAEPTDTAPGNAYILNSGRTGPTWDTLSGHCRAVWEDDTWQTLVIDDALRVHFNGSAWTATAAPTVENDLINGALRLW